MESLLQDLRYAVRTLGANKAFTALAVLCLALGIGTNVTMFSIVNAVLLKPFPFQAPERLAFAWESKAKADIQRGSPSYALYRDLRESAHSFERLATFDYRSLTITDGDEPLRLEGSAVSANLFETLGIPTALGRGFREDEDRLGAPAVVLISWSVWKNRYGGDPSIIGRTIRVNDVPRTVVGVMPERFGFPEHQDLWIPVAPLQEHPVYGARGNAVIGRLKPGVTHAAAAAEVAAIAAGVARAHPVEFEGWTTRVEPVDEWLIGQETELIILTMMGAVTFVLLIACANVANLMLARATARHREMAVRTALGAGRWRIVRQLLTESVIVALIAGGLGILLAFWGLDLVDAAIPASDAVPYYIHWSVDRQSLLYTIAVSVFTGLLFGLAPALQAVKSNLQEALKEGGRGSGAGLARSRLRSALVIGEVALALVLLVGASLFVRSFLNLQRLDAGFDSAPLMTMRYYMPVARYPGDSALARRTEDIVRRVEALPGVTAASASNLIPLGDGGDAEEILIEGRTTAAGDAPRIFWAGVTSHFFRTLDVPIVRGRTFTDDEAARRSSVAVIDQRMADRLFAGLDPIGGRFRMANDTTGEWFTVIGVARQFSYEQLDDTEEVMPAAYLPYVYQATPNTGLVVRVRGTPSAITRAVRGQIHAADPGLAVFDAAPMEQVRRDGYWQYALFGGMFSTFGALALALAAIGVYGVISYGVAQRTHEIGVRVALGARRGDVLRLVVGQGVRLAAIGIALGVLGAVGVTRIIGAILVDVSPTDPVSFIGVALFLTIIAAVASFVPARRASGVDPIQALRSE